MKDAKEIGAVTFQLLVSLPYSMTEYLFEFQ